MTMRSRHLTPSAKRDVLSAWHRDRAEMRAPTKHGGHGFPDPDMLPWTDQINQLPGVCTLQSCAGHTLEDASDPGAVGDSGKLWLWMDERTSQAFDREAFRLARRTDLIEEVSRVYSSWGQEIASVTFAGNERDSLDASMRLICGFLARIKRLVGR